MPQARSASRTSARTYWTTIHRRARPACDPNWRGLRWSAQTAGGGVGYALASMRDARVQRDVGLEELGDRTTRLGLGREFLKPGVVGSGNLRLECQVDGGDGEAVAHLVKRDLGGRLHALGSETRLVQNERQRAW